MGSKSDLEPKNKGLTNLAKCDFWLIFANFSTLDPQKWPKIKNLAKFPKNLLKTQKMQQLGQKWGPESYLEQKKQWFDQFCEKVIFSWILAIFQLWAPKNGQISKKLAEVRNNVWKTHRMYKLGFYRILGYAPYSRQRWTTALQAFSIP